MKKFFTSLLLAISMAIVFPTDGSAAVKRVLEGDPTQSPDGEVVLYESSQFFTFGEQYGWSYSTNMGEYVCFKEDKLYIEGLCGSCWAEGDIDPDTNTASFMCGQEVDEGTYINAYYKVAGQPQYLDAFEFAFTPDHKQIALMDYEGHEVTLVLQYASGYQGMKWSDVQLTLWTETPPEAPADGEVSFFSMDYTDQYGQAANKAVKMVRRGNDVWMRDVVYPSYIKGEVLENGNLYFEAPQFQGLIARYLCYLYAVMFDNEMSYFEFVANGDGTYTLEEYMELWNGDSYHEFCQVKNATLSPLKVYYGAPRAPQNVKWSQDYPHFIDFTLPMRGTGGERLRPEWTYWQVLVDGEVYVFTLEEYKDFDFTNNPDKFTANQYLQSYLNGSFVYWGLVEGNKYRFYMPRYEEGADIAVRCGYCPDGVMQWSDAVRVNGVAEKTPLPDEALYSTSVSIDTGWMGIHYTNGLGIRAEFGDDSVRLFNFFGDNSWIEGRYANADKTEAVFDSRQVVSSNYLGDITLVAAKQFVAASGDTPAQYQPIDNFTLRIAPGGVEITQADTEVYLLEVQQDGFVSNAWLPNLRLRIVTDKVAEVPDDAERFAYDYDSKQNPQGKQIEMARLGDKVWISDVVADGTWLEGSIAGNDIVIELPQFMGVIVNQVSYASGATFNPGQIVLKGDGSGNYECTDATIMVGTDYPEWPAASEMFFALVGSKVNLTASDSDIKFRNGKFISSVGESLWVYNLSGMRVENNNLTPGMYIVRTEKGAKKISVK